MMASGSGHLANDSGAARQVGGRAEASTLHNVHYRLTTGTSPIMSTRTPVPSHGSWRISLILADDLAEGYSVAMILRRAVEPVHPRTSHAQQIPSAKPG